MLVIVRNLERERRDGEKEGGIGERNSFLIIGMSINENWLWLIWIGYDWFELVMIDLNRIFFVIDNNWFWWLINLGFVWIL